MSLLMLVLMEVEHTHIERWVELTLHGLSGFNSSGVDFGPRQLPVVASVRQNPKLKLLIQKIRGKYHNKKDFGLSIL